MIRRRSLTLWILGALLAATPAAAQSARAMGTVRDSEGKPVKGAVIRAHHPDFVPSDITSTTDDRGRWGMVGLRTGTWRFIVQAPDHFPSQAEVPIRTANQPPLNFTLTRDPGLPGALDKNIHQQIADAHALRDQGRYEQALAAYQEIRARNPKLTSIHLVIGSLHRVRASGETDAAARRALLDRAAAAYAQALELDPADERARDELTAVRAEAAAVR